MPATDVLVIGSGIAGLSVAIKVARRFPDRHCLVITKQESAESNTRYAQGGIAVVTDFVNDSFERHIQDTLDAGDGLCDRAVVEHVVHQAPARLRELMEIGAAFDRSASGALLLGREGGHKANRIIHYQDATGLNIATALLQKARSLPNISLLSHHVAIDLITIKEDHHKKDEVDACKGAWVLNVQTGEVEKYLSRMTVLATGGIGQLYETTTNPLIATGDGIAIAHRAGARISNMEFVQFHPTALYEAGVSPAFLISEALRGQGAYLVNSAGERFMFRYHIDGELACRDVVSRAIASEMLRTDEAYVFLDCTRIPRETLLERFPNIYQTCLSKGIDISKQYIPVAPAAHYLCGGIDVDLRSRTTIEQLYACGECANTGLHGANRLASNSLLEATVFAHNCFEDIEKNLDFVSLASQIQHFDFPAAPHQSKAPVEDMKTTLQKLMSRFAGIVRSNEGLHYLRSELNILQRKVADMKSQGLKDPAWHELWNMLACAELVATNSLKRTENKGGFYNKDLAMDEVAG